jgi:hypothetical protein
VVEEEAQSEMALLSGTASNYEEDRVFQASIWSGGLLRHCSREEGVAQAGHAPSSSCKPTDEAYASFFREP